MRTRAGKAVGFWHTGYKEAHRGCLERRLFNWRRISEKKIQYGIQLPFLGRMQQVQGTNPNLLLIQNFTG